MDTRYYLAVDIGASSGRHMLSHMENGKMVLEEIYRFPNDMTEKAGHKVWDVDRLFEEILTGMKKCLEMGKFFTAWELTHGLWILSCWMKTIKCLEMECLQQGRILILHLDSCIQRKSQQRFW